MMIDSPARLSPAFHLNARGILIGLFVNRFQPILFRAARNYDTPNCLHPHSIGTRIDVAKHMAFIGEVFSIIRKCIAPRFSASISRLAVHCGGDEDDVKIK